ncbi:DUF2778 domain-containing protein [Cupriavidus campinensis]
MQQCTFVLNDEPMSAFSVGGASFPAFSGTQPYINKRTHACLSMAGPIPPGTYYILDRESGGRMGWAYELIGIKKDWFSLYADDGHMDDWTFCNEVRRGNFRLHPKGRLGESKGCIAIDRPTDFHVLYHLLKASGKFAIPKTNLQAYGKVVVK